MKFYSAYQFSIFRILFGYFLFDFFIHLLPHSVDVYSREGMFPLSLASPFPNILVWFTTSWQIKSIIGALTIFSFFYMIGWHRRIMAFLLWYGWACLLNRIPYVTIPSEGLIGWLLLASVLIPSGKPLSIGRKVSRWEMPKEIFYGAWIIFSLAYSASSIDKLQAISWRNGDILNIAFETPIARPWFLVDWINQLPSGVLKSLTWLALGLELSFAPLALFWHSRLLVMIGMVCMHLMVLLTFNLGNLSLSMLLAHFFILDARWFPGKTVQRDSPKPIIFIDGFCVLCQRFAQFILAEDKWDVFQKAALQGKTAKKNLPVDLGQRTTTIVLKDETGVYTKSQAIIRICEQLGGIWKFICIFRIFPIRWLDRWYACVAQFRYKIIGRWEQCQLPSTKDPKKILP